jgi:septal ring factor EnvC (AmiA/AmiB activator)
MKASALVEKVETGVPAADALHARAERLSADARRKAAAAHAARARLEKAAEAQADQVSPRPLPPPPPTPKPTRAYTLSTTTQIYRLLPYRFLSPPQAFPERGTAR